jgi:guanyl-specific ribonuclease Sa
MKQTFFVLLVLVALALGGVQAAAGQQTTENSTDDATLGVEVVSVSEQECTETIDNRTVICSSSVNSDGMMTIVLHAEMDQKLTLADGGAFRRGGQVPTRDSVLQ